MQPPSLTPDERKNGTKPVRSIPGVMMLFFLTLFSASFFPTRALAAGKEKMADKIIWPPQAAGWKWDGETRTFAGKSLYTHIDGAAEVYLAYGFKQVLVRRYVRAGQPDILAEVYLLGSSEDAYGVFSLERQDPEAGIGQGSEFGGSLLRFWKGPYFVTVLGNGTGREMEEAVLALGRILARGIKETGPLPRLLQFLPDQDTLPPPDRVCFVRSHVLLNRCFFISHQNILRLGPNVQALLARYPGEKNRLRLLLLRYPTDARARTALSSFKTAYLPESFPVGSVVQTEDGTWTGTTGEGNYVMVVFGAGEPAEAERFMRDTLERFKKEKP
jgi:hypothetical protein